MDKSRKASSTFQKKLAPQSIAAQICTGKNCKLDTDACNIQIKYMVLQEQLDKTGKVTDYCLRSLTRSEKAISINQRKCLLIERYLGWSRPNI